jgi:hypothetical protein
VKTDIDKRADVDAIRRGALHIVEAEGDPMFLEGRKRLATIPAGITKLDRVPPAAGQS